VYALPAAVLIAIGAREALRADGPDRARSTLSRVALLGFIGVPLVAAAFKEPRALDRALFVVPFGILLASHGFNALWQASPRHRVLAALVVAAAITQSLVWYAGFTSG
jgi:hypothetical protein